MFITSGRGIFGRRTGSRRGAPNWRDSLPHLMMRDWLGMSPLARTFCFFLLLWVCCAVLWHYVFWKGRVFWFIVLSAVYLSVLDTFTPYDGRRSLTLTVVAGLAMLLWLRSFHVLPWEAGRFRVKWLAGGLALIVFVTSVAYAAQTGAGLARSDPVARARRRYRAGQRDSSKSGLWS